MENSYEKYERATKRVKELKGFYNHLKIFIIVNLMFFLFRSGLLHRFLPEDFPIRPEYFNWIYANLFIWGLIILAHALITYRNKLPFVKNWEERQIKKYMKKEEEEHKKYH